VLARCERPGSLDSAIKRPSEQANPLLEWLTQHPSTLRICFNGKTAAALFRRHVMPELSSSLNHQLECRTLPSTSPAMASLTLSEKAAAWKPALLP